MEPDPEIIYSPLNRRYERDGVEVEVCIFRIEGSDWTLEVIDEFNNSTVWNEEFKNDEQAFADFEKTVQEEGMSTVSGMIDD